MGGRTCTREGSWAPGMAEAEEHLSQCLEEWEGPSGKGFPIWQLSFLQFLYGESSEEEAISLESWQCPLSVGTCWTVQPNIFILSWMWQAQQLRTECAERLWIQQFIGWKWKEVRISAMIRASQSRAWQ